MADLVVSNNNHVQKTIHTTQNHPFWDVTTQQWTRADTLKAGDQLATTTGDTVHVVTTHTFTRPQHMLNLTIANLHAYYVLAGDTPVLVHNDDAVPRWAKDEIARIKAGQGTPRMTGNDQTLYQGNESAAHARKWGPHAESGFDGTPEWEVQGKGNDYRIIGPNRFGEYGYTSNHYTKITVAPGC
jgi:hypothetical protein